MTNEEPATAEHRYRIGFGLKPKDRISCYWRRGKVNSSAPKTAVGKIERVYMFGEGTSNCTCTYDVLFEDGEKQVIPWEWVQEKYPSASSSSEVPLISLPSCLEHSSMQAKDGNAMSPSELVRLAYGEQGAGRRRLPESEAAEEKAGASPGTPEWKIEEMFNIMSSNKETLSFGDFKHLIDITESCLKCDGMGHNRIETKNYIPLLSIIKKVHYSTSISSKRCEDCKGRGTPTEFTRQRWIEFARDYKSAGFVLEEGRQGIPLNVLKAIYKDITADENYSSVVDSDYNKVKEAEKDGKIAPNKPEDMEEVTALQLEAPKEIPVPEGPKPASQCPDEWRYHHLPTLKMSRRKSRNSNGRRRLTRVSPVLAALVEEIEEAKRIHAARC